MKISLWKEGSGWSVFPTALEKKAFKFRSLQRQVFGVPGQLLWPLHLYYSEDFSVNTGGKDNWRWLPCSLVLYSVNWPPQPSLKKMASNQPKMQGCNNVNYTKKTREAENISIVCKGFSWAFLNLMVRHMHFKSCNYIETVNKYIMKVWN